MMPNRSDEALIEGVLTKLPSRYKKAVAIQKVQQGFSGASVYRIDFPDEKGFLKIATTTLNPVIVDRALREVNFYRDLAAKVPLLVPHMLATHEDTDTIALLIKAYTPSQSPSIWTISDYLEAARQLGQFHAAYWGKTELLSAFSWLKWYQSDDYTVDILDAQVAWQALFNQPRLGHVLNEKIIDFIHRLLARPEAIRRFRQLLPLTLCHGDCTTYNVLRDREGQFIWTDWQEVRLSYGPEDLAFFIHRASADGADVARDEMINQYCLSLQQYTGQMIQLPVMQRVMDASDLWVCVVHWPFYIKDASEAFISELIEKIHGLVSKLDLVI
ncbi:MAG: phosphotransferase [Chloroflexota bacterium]